MKKENEILEALKTGVGVCAVVDELKVSYYLVKKVYDKHISEIPARPERAVRYSVRFSPELNIKFLAEIHERGITPTQLLNEMAGDWYEKN